jgi:hypothetical protein
MPMSKFSKSSAALPHFVCKKPPPFPIPSVSKVKKMGKVDVPDADKTELIKLEYLTDSDNPDCDSKHSRNFSISKDGHPEE